MRDLSERVKLLNGANLKAIAMITMVMDHANKGLLISYLAARPSYPHIYDILSGVCAVCGTFAFPIFLYLLVEGFFKTRSRKRYFMQLMLFAFISEVPFDMSSWREYWQPGGQNIFFTLAMTVAMYALFELIRSKGMKIYAEALLMIAAAAIFAAFSEFFGADFGYHGILLALIFYLARVYFPRHQAVGPAAGYITFSQANSLPGFILLMMYNGKRGRQFKWFNYLFYPGHLLIIGILRFALGL